MTRYKFLKIVLLCAVAVILARLFFIQVIQYDEWVAKAAENHTLLETIVAKRGEIYMMDGNEPVAVVMNQTVYTVIVDPALADKDKTIEVVDKYAKDYEIAEWEDVFKSEEVRYYVVAKNVSREMALKISAEEISGIWLQENTKRVYPEGTMASQLLGFVNIDGDGQYGVEGALDEELSGTDGSIKTIADINNVALSIGNDNIKIPAVDGENVVLTIDRNMQKQVEKYLADAVNGSAATNASAIVMDPNSGEILVMANVPNYDPADYGNVKDASAYINYTVEEPYEPASVCKTFSFAAALDQGLFSKDTTYYNQGYMMVDGIKVENSYKGQLGTITMQTGLNYSLNTSSMYALMLLSDSTTEINQSGREKLYSYYDNFGFGKYTGIELYESAGVLVSPEQNEGEYAKNLTYATMTFGQGIDLTMIQVASAFSSVINGGNYYQPTVVRGKIVDGNFQEEEIAPAIRQTISAETSAAMREMLYGTRNSRRVRGIDKTGYYVGGKTGTAQVIRDGKYTAVDGETIASYIGFGGAEGELPEYVIMVKIWGEGEHMEGERDAMPLFDTISNYVQTYLKIQPKV